MSDETKEKSGKKTGIWVSVMLSAAVVLMASGVGFILWKLLGVLK